MKLTPLKKLKIRRILANQKLQERYFKKGIHWLHYKDYYTLYTYVEIEGLDSYIRFLSLVHKLKPLYKYPTFAPQKPNELNHFDLFTDICPN